VLEDSHSRDRECSERRLESWMCSRTTKDEIKEALKKMANGKAEGPDQIPIEVWKCLGEVALLRCIENGGLV